MWLAKPSLVLVVESLNGRWRTKNPLHLRLRHAVGNPVEVFLTDAVIHIQPPRKHHDCHDSKHEQEINQQTNSGTALHDSILTLWGLEEADRFRLFVIVSILDFGGEVWMAADGFSV